MRLEVLGQHVHTADRFHMLVGVAHHKPYDFTSAVEALQIASDMRSTLLGDHLDTAESYYWFGLANSGMENLNLALESFKVSLQLMKKLSVGDHCKIAVVINQIRTVYLEMGDYNSAREQFQNAVNLYEKVLEKHKSSGTSNHYLAIAYLALGNYPEALECFRQASAMRLEVLGQHVFTVNSFHMLGVVHQKINDFTSVVEAFYIASDIRSTLLGDHLDTAESYYWLGCEIGDLRCDLASLQKALQVMRELSTGDHPSITNIINKMGTVYYRMGDYMAAREQFQNVVDSYEKFFDNTKALLLVTTVYLQRIFQLEATQKLLNVLSRLRP